MMNTSGLALFTPYDDKYLHQALHSILTQPKQG